MAEEAVIACGLAARLPLFWDSSNATEVRCKCVGTPDGRHGNFHSEDLSVHCITAKKAGNRTLSCLALS